MATAHAFSEDLYRLLGVVNIVVPPLRERARRSRSSRHFRVRFAGEFNRPQPKLSSGFWSCSRLRLAGNVRELENLVKRGSSSATTRT